MPYDELKRAGLDEIVREYKQRLGLLREPLDLGKFGVDELAHELQMRLDKLTSVHGEDDNIPALPAGMVGTGDFKKVPPDLLLALQIPPAEAAAQLGAVGRNQGGVAMIVAKRHRHATTDGHFIFETVSFGDTLCASSRFSDESCVPDAFSGFLVGERRIATARHAVSLYAETELCVIFGVARIPKVGAFRVLAGDVYDVTKTLATLNDCTCLELDRPVQGRTAAPVRDSRIEDGCPVYMLGHPRGLALKIAGNARVVDNTPDGSFTATVDAYGGHSGSPIFRVGTHDIVGMLLGSNTELQLTSVGCKIIKSTFDPLDPGEACARASVISALTANIA